MGIRFELGCMYSEAKIDLFWFNVHHPEGICRQQKHKQTNKITKNKTLDKRNPPPLTVSYAPLGDEGPTVYIQTKKTKNKKQKTKNKKQTVPRADKKKSRWVVKYSAVYVESKTHSDLRSRADVVTEKPMDCKYAVVQSSGRVVERYRGKRTQPKRLDRASMRDPSLNLPQGEVDNRLRINQPHS
jgi:hypothetical protein